MSPYSRRQPMSVETSSTSLQAANGTSIPSRHDLLIDIRSQRLLRCPPGDSPLLAPLTPVSARATLLAGDICGLRSEKSNAVEDLLRHYPSIAISRFDQDSPPAHGISHTVPMTGAPVFARARSLMGDKLAAAQADFQKMLDMKIIRPSKSAWSSPIHVVPKPNLSWRPCGDYRRLNLATADDRYPLPHIHSFAWAGWYSIAIHSRHSNQSTVGMPLRLSYGEG